jgi:hypothetical protein
MRPSRRARSHLRKGVSFRFLVLAGVVTVAAVGGGVLALGNADEPAPSRTVFSTTPLAGYDTARVVVGRGPFCDRVDERQVSAALGADFADSASWQTGDTIDLGNGVQDVAHEFGCRWTGADGTMAQAWVFATQVGADQAQRLVRAAAKGPGCEVGAELPFGSPTLALTCTKDGVVRASYRGLFGDAWLLCEVARPAGATWDVTDRAGRWCVGVLRAAGT